MELSPKLLVLFNSNIMILFDAVINMAREAGIPTNVV
jgi:hypothetical protein